MKDFWLFTDLDRTILPNGRAEESPLARPLFRALASNPWFHLVYVSGRHEGLLKEAIRTYDLPWPDFAVGDVGTTIYRVFGARWAPWPAWAEEIGRDWSGVRREELASLFADLRELQPQEPEKQNTYKLSYYAPAGPAPQPLLATMRQRLEGKGVRASLIWSVDELKKVGLLDVLPASATKVHAIRFLMQEQGISEQQVVFAGDSGNDLPALTSGLAAVLVRNGGEDVRQEALEGVRNRGFRERLYLARGDFPGLNGNYTAGVLEGVAHFFPAVRAWLEKAALQHQGKLCDD